MQFLILSFPHLLRCRPDRGAIRPTPTPRDRRPIMTWTGPSEISTRTRCRAIGGIGVLSRAFSAESCGLQWSQPASGPVLWLLLLSAMPAVPVGGSPKTWAWKHSSRRLAAGVDCGCRPVPRRVAAGCRDHPHRHPRASDLCDPVVTRWRWGADGVCRHRRWRTRSTSSTASMGWPRCGTLFHAAGGGLPWRNQVGRTC